MRAVAVRPWGRVAGGRGRIAPRWGLVAGLVVVVGLAGAGLAGCRSTAAPRPAAQAPAARPQMAAGQAEPARPVGTIGRAGAPGPGSVSVDLSGSPTAAPPVNGIPDRIDIPAIGVHAPVETLGTNPDGSRQVPEQFGTVGWYSDTAHPGDPGPAVLAGHVDSFRGPAVFFRLGELRAGAVVTVSSGPASELFRVTSVSTYPKDRFPTDTVFGPVPDSELRLVTCGGPFDRSTGSYRDNVVVFLDSAGP